jgi:serine/threonine protein kinase
MRHRDGDVLDKYEVVKTIGEGSMGAISKAKIRDHKIGGSAYQTQEETLCGCFKFLFGGGKKHSFISQSQRRSEEVYYALKTIVLGRVSPEFIKELRNEIDILQSMDHPNIVKAFEVFENKVQIFIVMELCSGGDLYKRLPYSERDASSISSKLCSAIAYMHSKDIVHRDLKFENIMWESDAPDAEIKVIDFGLSKKFLPTERHRTMTEGVGTIYTMAPQVLQGIYTSQADLWSLGVISFMLVSSQKPFYHKRRRQVIDRIMRCDYNFQGQIWEMASAESKDFINKLLVLDPKLRMNASQALKHPWLTKQFRLSMRKPAGEMLLKVQGNLLAFKDTSALKKVALNVIAHKSSTNEIYHLREAFKEYDTGNDGVICFDE